MLTYAVIFPRLKELVSSICGETAILSYPLPDVENGIRVERSFLYAHGSEIVRTRPFAVVTTAVESGRLLSYQDCRLRDFFDTARHPFSQPIRYELQRKIGVKEFRLEQDMINKLYETVRRIAFQETIQNEEARQLGAHYLMLEKAVPADLIPYYQAIGKNYYDWVVQYV